MKPTNPVNGGNAVIPNAYNRREFLTRAMVASAGAALGMSAAAGAADAASAPGSATPATPNAEKLGWRICCQLYTFRDRTFYEALDVISGLGVRRVEPAFFCP